LQGAMMKKRYIFLIVIILLIGVCMLNFPVSKQVVNQEIQSVAKNERAKELMEETIRDEDPKAFTDEGIIKSYEIDYNTVKHNPMGGFSVLVYINGNKDLYINFSFVKYTAFDIGSYSVSSELDDMLRGGYYAE
jgi:hypothetical protein